MAGPLALETPPLPVNGLDTTSSPGSMPSGYAPTHQNLLVHRTGLLPFRGPINDPDSIELGDRKIITGVWTSGDHALVGFAEQGGDTEEPWTRALRPNSVDTSLAVPEQDMLQINFGDGTSSTLSGSVGLNDVISGRGAALKEFVYGYPYSALASGEDSLERNYWARKVVAWDVIGGTVTELTTGPRNGLDVIAHLSRMFVLGGCDIPGGDTNDDMEWNSLFYSDLFGPTTDTDADWKDNDSGLVNKIVVGEDSGDFGVGLAHVGQDLVIFKRRAIYVLYGYSPDTFNVKPLAQEIGCLDQRSICEYGGAVYWLSAQGLQSWDGESLNNLSRPVEATLNRALALTVGDQGVDGGFACVSKLANDYLLVSVGQQSFSTGALRAGDSLFCAMVHAPTGRWTTFRSEATASVQPTFSFNTMTHQVISDTENLIKVNYVTDPELAEDRGLDTVGALTPARTNLLANADFSGDTPGDEPAGYTDSPNPPFLDPVMAVSQDNGIGADGDPIGGLDPALPPFVSTNRNCAVVPDYDAVEGASDATVETTAAVTNGTEYTFSVYLAHPESGEPNYRAQLEVADNASVVKATSTTTSIGDSDWVRKSVTFTADSTATWKFRIKYTPAGGAYGGSQPQYFAAPMVEASDHADDFIVGTDPGGVAVLARIPVSLDYPMTLSSTPDLMSQAHRILVDYTFQVVDELDDAVDGPLVSAQNGDGSVVQTAYALPSQGEDGDYLCRRRHVKDCHNEISDAVVRFRYQDDSEADVVYPALAKAELYNVHIEFQSTRQKRST